MTATTDRMLVHHSDGKTVSIPDMGLLYSGSELSARNAELLYTSAQMLHAQWSDWLLGGQLESMRALLPDACEDVDEVFCSRFARGFADLGRRMENGQLPRAECTGDELALRMILAHAARRVTLAGSVADALVFHELDSVLPEHGSDGDMETVSETICGSDAVLGLYEIGPIGHDRLARLLAAVGADRLLPEQWFLPHA